MDTKHTPGPWVLSPSYPYRTNDAHGQFVADTSYTLRAEEEQEANAHLIAAAPDMLAALIEVVRWDEISGIDAEWPVVMETVRAAIAKAKGE